MQHDDYDIGDAFRAIEDELISSMIRNMDRHRAKEDEEGILWSQWQAEQLKSLEQFKVNNKKYEKQFQSINQRIEELLRMANENGSMEQETEILEAIKNGFSGYKHAGGAMTAEFFRLNDRKLDALIQATTHDMQKAETAILRMANDKYRKAIFNAQVYANSGAGSYEKAVDMATHDMLSAGLNCVEYANGARHTLANYADMAVRTAGKRAYLQGEGTKRQEWGISTVIINKRGNPCPKCLPFVGKVLIDDVWSGGKASDGPYPLMSTAIAAGMYHPRCRDSHTTYFPGISTADDTWTKRELNAIEMLNRQEAQKQYAKRQGERFCRLAKYSLDEENRKKYDTKVRQWREMVKEYRVINEDGSRATFRDRVRLKDEISRLPKKMQTALDDVIFKINSDSGSGYLGLENTIYLSKGASGNEIIHEIGHAIEKTLFHSLKVDDFKRKVTQGLTKDDIIIKTASDSAGNKKNIFLIKSDRFVKSYQSRLYVDNIAEALNSDGSINIYMLGEFVSVAVEYYFTYPETMKKHFKEMYDMVEEAIL